MKELVCIVCPRGCTLFLEENEGEYSVTGNFCKKGKTFALAELTNPLRSICSSVKTIFPEVPVLPVRVSSDIPKSRIFDVMRELKTTLVKKRVKRGEIIIKNVLGLGVDIIATSSILQEPK